MKNIFKNDNNKETYKVAVLSGATILLIKFIFDHYATFLRFAKEFFNVSMPFVIGTILALILVPLSSFLELSIFKKLKKDIRRPLSSILSVLLFISLIVLLVVLLIPALSENFTNLSFTLQNISRSFPQTFGSYVNSDPYLQDLFNQGYSLLLEFIQDIIPSFQKFIPTLISTLMDAVNSFYNFTMGLIICLYILIDRHKIYIAFKKIALAFFSDFLYKHCARVYHLSITKFISFIKGKILDSFIVGILCFIALNIFQIKFSVLIAIFVGVTDIIPFFGPFFGAIPSFALLMLINPIHALIFLVIIIVIQQIDGNFIAPYILGDSVGLSSLWIIFSLIIGGYYFGFLGMLLAIPVCSTLYILGSDIVQYYLKKKNKNI